jgi:hypothetical protein
MELDGIIGFSVILIRWELEKCLDDEAKGNSNGKRGWKPEQKERAQSQNHT